MNYDSTKNFASECVPGVRYTIARMTFGRRIELMRQVRQLSARLEFERAGLKVEDKLQASLLGAEIDSAYLRWGLLSIGGLQIDGASANAESLITSGPEALCREIVRKIKRECALTEEERKN